MHFKEFDWHSKSMDIITQALMAGVIDMKIMYLDSAQPDGIALLDNVESIIGTFFVASQAYINKSIFDATETLKNRSTLYALSDKIDNTDCTEVELVVALANYFKHKDDDQPLHHHTVRSIKAAGILISGEITESPIIRGLEKLTPSADFEEVKAKLYLWRQRLWD